MQSEVHSVIHDSSGTSENRNMSKLGPYLVIASLTTRAPNS